MLWSWLGTLRQTVLLLEALIVSLRFHAGALRHRLLNQLRRFTSDGMISCDNAHRHQESCHCLHNCRSEATPRVLEVTVRDVRHPSLRAQARRFFEHSRGF